MGFAMITNASFPSSGLFLAYQHDLPKLKMDAQHLIRHARAFADHLKTSFSIGIAASILAWGSLSSTRWVRLVYDHHVILSSHPQC